MWSVWRWRTLALSEEQLFLLLAILIGLFSGMAVVCFRIAIDWIRLMMLGSSLAPSRPRVLLAPTIVGLVVAVLVIYVFPRSVGSGVHQTKAAVYIFDGYIPFRTVIAKFLVCALAIGSHSLGPEILRSRWGPGLHLNWGGALAAFADILKAYREA